MLPSLHENAQAWLIGGSVARRRFIPMIENDSRNSRYMLSRQTRNRRDAMNKFASRFKYSGQSMVTTLFVLAGIKSLPCKA
jgi:hypothetical protein